MLLSDVEITAILFLPFYRKLVVMFNVYLDISKNLYTPQTSIFLICGILIEVPWDIFYKFFNTTYGYHTGIP